MTYCREKFADRSSTRVCKRAHVRDSSGAIDFVVCCDINPSSKPTNTITCSQCLKCPTPRDKCNEMESTEMKLHSRRICCTLSFKLTYILSKAVFTLVKMLPTRLPLRLVRQLVSSSITRYFTDFPNFLTFIEKIRFRE